MSSVIDDLAEWGPQGTSKRAPSRGAAEAYCRELARSHYENFPVASLLLPRSLRQHVANLYAYCRWADDLADETRNPGESLELLSWFREELDRCFVTTDAGSTYEVRHPVFVALRPTVTAFDLPRQPFADLLSAFAQDQRVHRYQTFDQLLDYCRRSANPVGRLVLHLCRNVSDQTFAWSDSICTGLQLTNFWQDVARDFEIGRVYLPAEDRQRFGYDDADLESRVTNDAFVELMHFEVDRARQFLVAGLPLVKSMRGRMQVSIEMFVRGGLHVLDQIETIGCRVWDTRPVVSRGRLAMLSAGCLGRAMLRPGGLLRG